METMKLAIFHFIILGITLSAQAQFFEDLDFESANLSNATGSPPEAPVGDALPGWSVSVGGVPRTQVFVNGYSTGEATVDVLSPMGNSIDPGIIGGDHSVFLQAFNQGQGNVSLSQTGLIPASAASIRFSAWQYLSVNEAFTVSIDGNSLSPVAISTGQAPSGQTFTEFGINIGAYAGQTGQLEFTAYGGQGPDWVELDDITFSTTTVTPEPDTLALLLLGGIAFAAKHWRRKGS